MIRGLLASIFLICITAQISKASYTYVEAYLQHDSSDCAPVRLGNSVYYTHPSSPECASELLKRPGMDSLVTAAVNLALSQKEQTEERLRVTSGQGYIGIEVNSLARDLDGATIDIYDASGKLMDAHHKIQGHNTSAWYTMSVAGFPPGPYKAVLRKKDGQTIESLFVLK